MATVCVAVLAVSGVLHGWSRAGSLGDLFTTGYGHAFWLKVAAVTAMLVVANGNRLYVLRHVESAAAGHRRAAAPAPARAVPRGRDRVRPGGHGADGILVGAPVEG